MNISQFTWNQRNIDKLPPHDPRSPSSAKEYSDPVVKGLKLENNKSGRKIYWFKSTFRGEKIKIKIGEATAQFLLTHAREIALAYRSQIDRGINPKAEIIRDKEALTFRKFFVEQYLVWAYQNKRSANADESKFKHHLDQKFGTRRLDEITRREIEQHHSAIKQSHCAATANRHLALLSIVFQKCLDWGVLTSSPVQGIKKFKEDNQVTEYLSKDEMSRLVAALEQDPNTIAKYAICFLLATGCRRQEALSLRWDCVNFEARTIYLEKTKAGKSRHVPLNDSAINILKRLRSENRKGPWVFPSMKDPNLPYVNLRKPLDRAAHSARLGKHVWPHLLRHSFASLLVSQNVSIFVVKELIGHSTVSMTERYSHVANDTLRESSQVFSRLVG